MKNTAPTLVVLDVGHGSSNVIQENDAIVIVDTGSPRQLLEYLFQKNITVVELVVLSHSDADHISGLAGILSSGIQVKAVQLNGDADKATEAWRDLVKVLGDAHHKGQITLNVGIANGVLSIGAFSRVTLEVIAPTREMTLLGVGARNFQGQVITSNSISAVIRILYEGTSIALLTGDMDDISLDEIIEKKIDAAAQYLVFPHHGGLPGKANPAVFTQKILAAVKPHTVLFSHGRDKHSNPNAVVIQTIKNQKIRIGCTQLSKQCAEEAPQATRGITDLYSAGRRRGICCAGTMEIQLNVPEFSEPTKTEHPQFILNFVPAAMCRSNAVIS